MVDAAPFRAWRYDPAVAGPPEVTSAPAYDELERFAYATHRTAGPYTALELLLDDADGRFEGARATLRRWLRTGVLRPDPRPHLYFYAQDGQGIRQQGYLAAVALDQDILPHEDVDPRTVQRRLERLRAVPLDLTPAVAIHTGGPRALAAAAESTRASAPSIDFVDADGLRHRVWTVPDDLVAGLRSAYRDLRVVLADGHHRLATARRALAATAGRRDGDGPETRTLLWLVDTQRGGPELRAVHRLVRSWAPGSLSALDAHFVRTRAAGLTQAVEALRAAPGVDRPLFGLLRTARTELLQLRPASDLRARLPADRSAQWRALDAALLDDALLPLLAAEGVEPCADPPAGASEVMSGRADALWLLRPATVAQVVAVATAGERMPAKTTWFRPKPRSGLIMRAATALDALAADPSRT